MSVKGCDANATNKFGMVPLHHAAVHGDPNVIEALIKGGGEVCILSKISFNTRTIGSSSSWCLRCDCDVACRYCRYSDCACSSESMSNRHVQDCYGCKALGLGDEGYDGYDADVSENEVDSD